MCHNDSLRQVLVGTQGQQQSHYCNLETGPWTDMCVDMCTDMCVDMCTDMCIAMRMGMHAVVCIDGCETYA